MMVAKKKSKKVRTSNDPTELKVATLAELLAPRPVISKGTSRKLEKERFGHAAGFQEYMSVRSKVFARKTADPYTMVIGSINEHGIVVHSPIPRYVFEMLFEKL